MIINLILTLNLNPGTDEVTPLVFGQLSTDLFAIGSFLANENILNTIERVNGQIAELVDYY